VDDYGHLVLGEPQVHDAPPMRNTASEQASTIEEEIMLDLIIIRFDPDRPTNHASFTSISRAARRAV
jgi:hypothetical protein